MFVPHAHAHAHAKSWFGVDLFINNVMHFCEDMYRYTYTIT